MRIFASIIAGSCVLLGLAGIATAISLPALEAYVQGALFGLLLLLGGALSILLYLEWKYI